MAIGSRTATVVENASATSLTGTLPTGLANNDVLVAFYTNTSSSTNLTGPSGYTQLFAPFGIGSGETIAGYYKVVTNAAGESGPAAFWTTAGRATCIVQAYTGVDTSAPIDVSAVTAGPATTGTLAVGPVTIATAGARLLSAAGLDSATSSTLTVPSGMTQVGASTGTGRRLSVADETVSATGSTGTRTWTQSGTVAFSAALAALRPAGSGGVTPTLTRRVVGVPTTTTGRVAVRTTNATSVRLKVGTDSGVTSGVVFGSAGTPNAQGDTQLTVTGLSAGTQYYYRIGMTPSGGSESFDTGAVGKFRTAPSGQANFAFCFGSCSDTSDAATFTTIANRNDDLFLHLGDLWYSDGSSTSVANYRTTMYGRLTGTNQGALYATTPSVFTPSDHEGMNNNSTAGTDATAWTNYNSVYRELIPTPTLPGGSTGVYYTFTWGRLRFIVLDGRSFKSNPANTDNSSKTVLGATQKQWVKDTITAAAEPVIVIVNADPWIGSASAGDDDWRGFTTERTEMANFFSASGKNIVMTSGDMHALAAEDGSGSPGGVPLFYAAPFYNTGSQKGGPYDVGPYPTDGSLVQQYGRMVVTDTGTQVSLVYTGYSSDNTQRVTLTKTYSVAAGGSGGVSGATSIQRWANVAGVKTSVLSRRVHPPVDDPTSAASLFAWGTPLAGSDEFEYTGTPDSTKWNPPYDDVARSRFPARVTVTGGKMVITGLSGSASTGGIMHKTVQQYGRWEVRCRTYYTNSPTTIGTGDTTTGSGYHPVLIVWPSNDVWPGNGEYDFFENYDVGDPDAGAYMHYPSLNGVDSWATAPMFTVDTRQFHNYAVEWTSSYLKGWVDGQPWYTISGGAVSGVKQNVQNMTGGGVLTVQLDAYKDTGCIAATMEVEWARVYTL